MSKNKFKKQEVNQRFLPESETGPKRPKSNFLLLA